MCSHTGLSKGMLKYVQVLCLLQVNALTVNSNRETHTHTHTHTHRRYDTIKKGIPRRIARTCLGIPQTCHICYHFL